MSKFYVFAARLYYPNGGLEDFIGIRETIGEARICLNDFLDEIY